MSKGNFATGTMSGKLGIYVFMRRMGEQVQRSYVKPANTRTLAQGVQRSSLANIIRIYQASPSFFAKAFENKKSNQSDYNALVARNLGKAPLIYLPKEVAQAGGGVVAPYLISDGSLQSIIVTGLGITARTNIAVGASFTIGDETTVAQLTQAILTNNTFILEGDQLSYISFEQYNDQDVPKLRARKYELTLSLGDTTLVRAYMPENALSVTGGFIAHGEYVYSGAFAWVLSRLENNKLKVSRQSLIVTENDLYSSYMGNTAATRAAASYRSQREVFLNPDYISTAGADVTTTLPSVASVSIEGHTLSSSARAVELDAAGTIPAQQLIVQGSHMQNLTSLSITVTGAPAEGADTTETVTVPMTIVSNTRAENTSAISIGTIKTIKEVSITINSAAVFSWRYKEYELG